MILSSAACVHVIYIPFIFTYRFKPLCLGFSAFFNNISGAVLFDL